MDAVRDRIFTRVSPAREKRGERCSEAIRCEREEQGRSASVAFVQCALRCAFLVLLLLLSHPTRKPSFPAAWKSVRRCSVWEVIASRVRLGDRAATCTCTCPKYTQQTGLPLLTQHFQEKRPLRGVHVEQIILRGDHHLHPLTYTWVSTAYQSWTSSKTHSSGHLSLTTAVRSSFRW